MDTQLTDVKTDLVARIAAIDVRAPYAEPAELAGDIDTIRAIAHRHRLHVAVTVAQVVQFTFARGEQAVHGWLSMLADAVASERQDGAACDAFAAACSVRLTG